MVALFAESRPRGTRWLKLPAEAGTLHSATAAAELTAIAAESRLSRG